jgi:hypothetical protein
MTSGDGRRRRPLTAADLHEDALAAYLTRPGMVTAGRRNGAVSAQRGLAVSLDTLRIGAVKWQPGEELGRHTPATAAGIMSTAATRSRALW